MAAGRRELRHHPPSRWHHSVPLPAAKATLPPAGLRSVNVERVAEVEIGGADAVELGGAVLGLVERGAGGDRVVAAAGLDQIVNDTALQERGERGALDPGPLFGSSR